MVPARRLVRRARDGERLDDEHVLGAYYAEATEHDGVSPFPTHGFFRNTAKGPWQVTLPYEQARIFAEKVSKVVVSKDVWGGERDIELEVDARRALNHNGGFMNLGTNEKVSSEFLKQEACWAEVSYTYTVYEGVYIETSDVSKAFKNIGVNVFRAARPQAKVTDEKGDLRPLGPEARKNVFNLTLKPSGKSVPL